MKQLIIGCLLATAVLALSNCAHHDAPPPTTTTTDTSYRSGK